MLDLSLLALRGLTSSFMQIVWLASANVGLMALDVGSIVDKWRSEGTKQRRKEQREKEKGGRM
jgi:hypothetical protein